MSMSGKFLYMISDDPPLEKQHQIGCMTGILQLFDRHHIRSLNGNKRISARTWYGLGSPKNVPRLEYPDNGEEQAQRGSVDSPGMPKRTLAFKDVVTKSIQRDQGSNPTAIAALEKYEKIEASLQYCLSPDLRRRPHRRVNSTESIELPSQSGAKLVDKSGTEPARASIESRESVSSRFFPGKDRPRYSCDGREIPRSSPALDHKDAYRCSSLRASEGSRLCIDSPSRRPASVVARLMGLDDMPDPGNPRPGRRSVENSSPRPTTEISSLRPVKEISSPRASMPQEMIKQPVSVSEVKPKDQEANHGKDDNDNNSDRLSGYENIIRREPENIIRKEPVNIIRKEKEAIIRKGPENIIREEPEYIIREEDFNVMAETPVTHFWQSERNKHSWESDRNTALHALFGDYNKNRKVDGDLEDCDRDLQVLENIVEAMKLKHALRFAAGSVARSSDTEFPVASMKPKPADLEDTSTSSTSRLQREGLSSQRDGGSVNRPIRKKDLAEDQRQSNSVRSKSAMKSLNFSNDVSPRRSRPVANKSPEENSNAVPANQPYQSSSRYISLPGNNEALPSQKLKRPKLATKEQRNKTGMEIRMEKTNSNKNESRNSRSKSASKFNLQNPKSRRSLDFGPESMSETAKGTSEAWKVEQRTPGNASNKEIFPSSVENICEKEVITELLAENPCEVPAEPSPASVLDHSFYKEANFLSPFSMRSLDFEEKEAKLADNLKHKGDTNSDRSSNKEILKVEALALIENHEMHNDIQGLMVRTEPNSADSTNDFMQNEKHTQRSLRCNESQTNYCKVPEYNYVMQLFRVSGLLKDDEDEDISIDLYSHCGFSIDAEIFRQLEKKYIDFNEGDNNVRINRRLVFDTVNEILRRKSNVPPYTPLPQRRASCLHAKLSGRDLLNEVLAEIQSLSHFEWGDIIDGVIQILDKDSEMWADDRRDVEVGDLVLDVERSIFRYLIDELVSDWKF